jgi:Cellulose biosynthesis protein BcsN
MRRLRLPPRPGLASLLATVLIGTGCTPGAGLGPRMDGPQRIADARSMVVLPPELEADRLMVWREVQDNYIDERVVLANQTATAGENVIDVHTYWRGTAHPALFAGPMPNPFAADKISKRIADAFGDWAEVSAPRDRANRHGPYRYVAATADGVRCVLAWQMIDAVAAITRESETYAVEYRVCDPKREPEQLVALFDRIGLAPDL